MNAGDVQDHCHFNSLWCLDLTLYKITISAVVSQGDIQHSIRTLNGVCHVTVTHTDSAKQTPTDGNANENILY